MRRLKGKTSGAFTLIEILIVLAILGISVAVVVPMIGDRGSVKTAAAARKIIADLNYIQNMAIATQRPHLIRFGDSEYDLAWRESTTIEQLEHPINKTPFVVGFGSKATEAALADVTIQSVDIDGKTALAFDAFGGPQAYDANAGTFTDLSAPATIKLGSGESSMTIQIQPFTGEISVQ